MLFALEIDPEAARTASIKVDRRLAIADARSAPFKSASFDLVISFEVFEHITEVERYLAEAYRLLKRGGLFIMSTPNVETYKMAGMNPYHVKEYTVDEVKQLTSEAGFEHPKIFAQIASDESVARLEKSKLLLTIMKLKRRFGFHGDLLPKSIQRVMHKKIAKSDLDHFNPDDYYFIEGKEEEPELIYIMRRSSTAE